MTISFAEAELPASTVACQPAVLLKRARVSARGLLTTAQHTMTLFGFSAVAMVIFLMARPDLAKDISNDLLGTAPAPVAPRAPAVVPAPHMANLMAASAAATAPEAAAAPVSPKEQSVLNKHKQQQWVTSWLSKRYRVAGDATNMLVSTAYLTANEIKLDPLLILAVMAIESGLNPFAESPVGAQGLMQIMSKVHHEKFQEMGGVQAALNPVTNIRVGSLILKDYVTRGGSVEAGLKTYVGAAAFETDSGYGSRVLAEYRRLQQVSSGKKVPTFTPMMAAAAPAAEKAPAAAAAPAVPAPTAAPVATTVASKRNTQIAGL